uniref:Uncharacterized protein n=1 Tax=Arundo donax TaxID=35708 RepID=A0A0A9NKV6_ARUDO
MLNKLSACKRSYVLGYVEKASHQSWYVPMNPRSYIAPRVSRSELTGTTFITHTGYFTKEAANPPMFAFMSITFLYLFSAIGMVRL